MSHISEVAPANPAHGGSSSSSLLAVGAQLYTRPGIEHSLRMAFAGHSGLCVAGRQCMNVLESSSLQPLLFIYAGSNISDREQIAVNSGEVKLARSRVALRSRPATSPTEQIKASVGHPLAIDRTRRSTNF